MHRSLSRHLVPTAAAATGLATITMVGLLFGPLDAARADATARNLLANPGFEQVLGQHPAAWTCGGRATIPPKPPGSNFAHVRPDIEFGPSPSPSPPASAFASGSSPSLSSRRNAAPGSPNLQWRQLVGSPTASDKAECYQDVPVRPESSYTLSGWVRGGYAFLGTEYGYVFSPSSTQFTRLETTFRTRSDAASVRVFVHGWYAQPGYAADDLQLTGPDSTVRTPQAPTGLQALEVTSRTMVLDWVGSPGAARYRVLRDGAEIAVVENGETSLFLAGPLNAPGRSYSVVAVNDAGASSPSRTLRPLPLPPTTRRPDAVCCFHLARPGNGGIELSWTPAAGAVDGYYVYVDGVRAGWLYGVDAFVPNVPRGVHQIAVSALSPVGESALSPTINVTVS